jgi:RNA polymerase sigma factor (sigma-70 family)
MSQEVHDPDITDAFCTNYIRRTAQALVDDGFYPPGDLDDLVQELTLALFENQDDFDPQRGRWSTFVKQVVRSRATSLTRKPEARRRREGTTFESLSTPITDEDGLPTELGYTIREDQDLTNFGEAYRSDEDAVDLAHDLPVAIAKLPPDLRKICEALKTTTVSELARQMKVPRSTLMEQVAKIRAAFERDGLRDAI